MKSLAFPLTVVVSVLFGCTTDDDLGPYYEFTYIDSAFAVVSVDSVRVILTQIPASARVPREVPFQEVDDTTLADTVKFNLRILFGSYNQTPNPRKAVAVRQDSILLWYAHFDPIGFGLTKSATAAALNAMPEYYAVQHILIRKHPRKDIVFESKLYR